MSYYYYVVETYVKKKINVSHIGHRGPVVWDLSSLISRYRAACLCSSLSRDRPRRQHTIKRQQSDKNIQ